jgi:lipopolysaccharide/colanic/teichoic acid biosynthesis glycosyltransferase
LTVQSLPPASSEQQNADPCRWTSEVEGLREYAILERPTPIWKRTIDLLGVLVLVPLVLPLLLALALWIKAVSRGPVFFVQNRVGLGGKYFRIYKLRTMRVASTCRDSEHRNYIASYTASSDPLAKPNHRHRLIPGGNMLRRLSFDELPQLINVFLGNMSLVGPRPDVLRLEDYANWQLRRFEVVPGMTGLWQVSGKNRVSFEEMISLDIKYIDELSLSRDVRIVAKTIFVLLFEQNE